MENKIGFKKTELGYIPADWKVVRLGDVCNVQGEYGINAAAVEFSEKLPTYLRITDISDSGNFLKDGKKSVLDPNFEKFILNKGDIVFARTGATVGKTYLYDEKDGELVFAGFLIRFSPNDKVLDSYFLKLFTSTNIYWNWVTLMSMRSGQPGINAQEYSSLKLPLPPLPEQQKIATILSKWDELIETHTQLIEEKEKQKKGLMQKLLTGEVRFPGFEEEWEEKTLDEVATVVMGQSPSSKMYNNIEEGLPLIQGNADIKNRKTISRIWTNQITKTVEEGDIIMTVRAPVGAVGIASSKSCIGRGVCGINKHKIDSEFLFWTLMSFESKWKAFEQGSTFTAVNSSDVRGLQVRLPKKKNEQQKVAFVLSACEEEIQSLKDELEAIKLQKKGLMQQLLTGRIRVKI